MRPKNIGNPDTEVRMVNRSGRGRMPRPPRVQNSEAAQGVKRKRSPSHVEILAAKKGKTSSTSMQSFPPELLEHIISFLSVRDVVALGESCRYFHDVSNSEGIWRRICKRLSPRLKEEGNYVRSWRRAAILNATKGLYFQTFGGRRRILSKTVAPHLSHGYRRFLATKDHVFIMDYTGTLFFLKNALVSSTLGQIQWKRACRYVVLCRHAKDFASDPRNDTIYRKYLYVLATREQAPILTRDSHGVQQACDCVEVYLQSSGQRVFKMTFHSSMKFKQILLVGQETERSLLLLTEEGKVYSLIVNETQLDQPRSYTVQLSLRKISKCLSHIVVNRIYSNQSSVIYITDLGVVYFEVHAAGVYRDLFGTLHAFDPLDLQMPLALSLTSKVRYLKRPIDIWCGLNHSLVLTQGADFSKEVHGSGCGAGGRLPGWLKGSASFVKLHVKVPLCTKQLCSTRECLYMFSSYDVEESSSYRDLPAGKARCQGTDLEAEAARACEEYLSQLHKCANLEEQMAKMREIVGHMSLFGFQKDFFWEALSMMQRQAQHKQVPN
ncbi:F-box only protein 24 isoform X4 [Ambystoma mexicanum]|uniref:F-box only protein 24 isoform X4 n=1 Tax=Ambystoma mexicanum TaxID=8296 RepID=UPI0037E8F0D8